MLYLILALTSKPGASSHLRCDQGPNALGTPLFPLNVMSRVPTENMSLVNVFPPAN